METRTPETLSRDNYPWRCNCGQGCPNLFKGIMAFEGRKFCVFVNRDFVNSVMRNPKCPYGRSEVLRNMIKRESDEDW